MAQKKQRKIARRGRPPGLLVHGDILRDARERTGVTREVLESLTGLSNRTIQTAERGGPVSAETIRAMCEVLRLPVYAVTRRTPHETRQALLEAGLAPAPAPNPWWPRPPEMRWVADHLTDDEPQLCCIAGRVGIGKTALAKYVAAFLADEFDDGVVWLRERVRGTSSTTPVALQTRVATALGFDDAMPRPGTIDAAAFDQAFHDFFWRGRRLLVLDDVFSWRFVAHFVPPSGQVACLLTTSTAAIADQVSDTLVLTGLSDKASREVLRAHVSARRLDEDEEGTERLLRVLLGVPRALSIAGRVLQRERFATPGDYANRIAEQLDELQDTQEMTLAPDSFEARNASFRASFENLRQHVAPEVWSFLARIAVFGTSAFTPRWAAWAAGVDEASARRYLSDLTNLYMVQPAEPTASQMAYGRSLAMELETHAAWYAQLIGGAEVVASQARMVQAAVAHVQRTGATPPHAAERDLWDQVVRVLVSKLPSRPWSAYAKPGDVAPVDPSELGGAEALPHVVAYLHGDREPQLEARLTIVAGYAVASATEPRKAAKLARVLCTWNERFGDQATAEAWAAEADLLA